MTDLAPRTLPDKRYFRIGEVCEIAELKPHVLRYWETEFKQVKPHKTRSNQRLYRKKDVETILLIKFLLYEQKYTIAGAKAKLDSGHKADPAKGPAPRQLALEFDPAQREEFLAGIVAELVSIRDLLDKDPQPT